MELVLVATCKHLKCTAMYLIIVGCIPKCSMFIVAAEPLKVGARIIQRRHSVQGVITNDRDRQVVV